MPENTEKEDKIIYFSFLSDAYPSDNTETFDYIYNKMTVLAKAYDFSVVWRVSPVLANRLAKEKPVDKIYARVLWDKSECRRMLNKSEFVVTDTVRDASNAVSLGKETLLMYKKDVPEEYKRVINGAFISDGFEGILREAERKISGVATVPFLFDCPDSIKSDKKGEVVISNNITGTEDTGLNKEMLVLWEKYNCDKEKIIELRNGRKFDELSLLFDDLESAIKRRSCEKDLSGWDSEVLDIFTEVVEKEGLKEPVGEGV